MWKHDHMKQQLYSHLLPISKTIQVRQTRHVGQYWRCKDKVTCYVFLWTPTHGCASVGQPARFYINQLCANTGCSLEDLRGAMYDRDRWRESRKSMMAVLHDDDEEYLKLYHSVQIIWFLWRKVTWSYNCLLRIIISYLKPYNCVQTNNCY